MSVTLAPPPVVAPAELDFDARLALRDAEMTVRLESAGARLAVDATTPETVVDLADVVGVPVELPAPARYSTPVAALLQRAHARLINGGWCKGYSVDGQGATCLAWAIHREARGDVGLEVAGLNHLLDQIRAEFGQWDTVASWNDNQRDGRTPIRILGEAANTAATSGI